MNKIAVIGGAETVPGFRALGLEACPVSDYQEAYEALKRLTSEESGYAVIYIEEGYALQLQNEIDKFKDSPVPAIIVIPGRDGSTGIGLAALNAAVERAVGTNILN